MDRNLNLRPGETGEEEEHTQPRLHWGLGLRFGQVNNVPKSSDALGSCMLGDMGSQLGDGNQPGMKEQVRGDDSFCQGISACEVDDSTEWRGGRETTPQYDLLGAEGGAAD